MSPEFQPQISQVSRRTFLKLVGATVVGAVLSACDEATPTPCIATHFVQSGETLSGIAKEHDTSVTQLQIMNNHSSYDITAESPLKVPCSTPKSK